MPYYPKHQIKTNLFTNGDQYTLFQDKGYTGFYYETSKGLKYTGRFPGDGTNNPLEEYFYETQFPEDNPESFIGKNNLDYIRGVNSYLDPEPLLYDPIGEPSVPLPPPNYPNPNDRIIPRRHTPIPTQQEKDQGVFTRYFCKKSNEYRYIEISKEDFNKLEARDNSIAWDLYIPISLQWNLKGNSNSGVVRKIELQLKWFGFSSYIKEVRPL